MKIIANTTGGFLIQARRDEIEALMQSQGIENPKPELGTELPADQFALQIKRMQEIVKSYDFQKMQSSFQDIGKAISAFTEACKISKE